MIVITGISGFVGKSLSGYLVKKKRTVLGVSRNPCAGQINYKELNQKLLDRAEHLIHLAGKAHDLKNCDEQGDYYEANTELTKDLFDKFLKSDCGTFIFMSSVKAVADCPIGVLTEAEIPNPVTHYGKSKLAAERYILSKEIPRGKRVYILRPCMIHGRDNIGNLNILYSFFSRGIPYPLGKYSNKRSFLSVENLCFIINELIENTKINSGIFNLADDSPLSTLDLMELISKGANKRLRIFYLPKLLVGGLARIGDFLPIVINSERLRKLTEDFEVSNLKIMEAVQKPLPVSVEEGIRKTISSFKIQKKRVGEGNEF